MTQDDAISMATAALGRFDVPADFKAQGAQQSIIEVVAGAPVDERPEQPGPVRDVLAWLVMFSKELMFVEIAVDDNSGEIVRVVRSR